MRLGFGLSRELWLVQIGVFLNTLGWGAVLPFEVIYLHNGRGLSLEMSGLVVGTVTGVGVVAAPLSGPLIDRFGARACATGAGIALAAGYGWLAFVRSPLPAFAAAAIAGAGNGALNPSQSTLLATLAPPELRHRATAVSRVATNAGFGIGGAVGGLVATYGLEGFVTLFLANAVTYLLYVLVLRVVVREDPRSERLEGGYRLVLRDRAFLHLAAANVAVIAVGWGALPWLVPPYARNTLAIDAQLIGLLMLANAAAVVVAQVPVARFAEGRRRVVLMAAGAALIAVAFALVTATTVTGRGGYALLVAAAVVIGVGECFHTTALMPLVADLAPPGIRGRYMAAISLSWWIGLALAPAAGTGLLAQSPRLVFTGCAALAAAAGVALLSLEPRLPAASRLTPVTRLAADRV